MNKNLHRIIFSKHLGQMVVVAETVASQHQLGNSTRARRGSTFSRLGACGLAALSLLGFIQQAYAAPVGGAVVGGRATITQGAALTTIQQSSNRAIVNWQSFGIGAGETVRINAPGADSATLNRVVGSLASHIDGSLLGNGRVFLVNQNGVVIGRDGVVNVNGGFVASTQNLSDSAFMSAGALNFSGDTTGRIQVLGTVKSSGGDIIVIAPKTEIGASAQLQAAAGLQLIAASDVTLSNGKFTVSPTVGEAGQLSIAGTLEAAQVQLTAVNNNLGALAINANGTIRATGVQANPDGSISLVATGLGGNVTVNNARFTAKNADLSGGHITLSGHELTLTGSTQIDARGTSGGTVLIGGDAHGENAVVASATRTVVDENVSLTADSTNSGSGGKVIVWADDSTHFLGSISAKGGAAGGDGGFVEVSGKNTLDFQGLVDTSALHGNTGTLLLDPTDITISTAANSAMNGATPFTGTGATSVLNTITLQTALANNNVVVDTSSAFAAPLGGTIVVANAVTWASTNGLTLLANKDINVNAALTNTGKGGITLKADQAATGLGDVNINANLATRGGAISVSGANILSAATTTIDSNSGGAAANVPGSISFTATSGGIILNSTSVSANATSAALGGTITLNAAGAITVGSSLSARGSSAPTVAGLDGGTVSVTSTAGAVSLSGNINVLAGASAVANSTKSGTVNVTGASVLVSAALSTTATTNSGVSTRGGEVNLVSTAGDLTVSTAIDTSGAEGSGTNTAGHAGKVTLSSSANMTVAAITASGGTRSLGGQTASNAGNIVLTATGAVKTGAITSSAGNSYGGVGGAVGGISVTGSGVNSQGADYTTSGLLDSNAGNISVHATTGNLILANLTANAGDFNPSYNAPAAVRAGNITLVADAGNVAVSGSVKATQAQTGIAGPGTVGGAVGMSAATGISVAGLVNVSGAATLNTTAGFAGGNSGSINLVNTVSGDISVTGAMTANAGGVALVTQTVANAGLISPALPYAINVQNAGGKATLGILSTSGGVKAAGGAVNISAVDAVATGAVNSAGGAGLTSIGGDGGKVSISGTTVDTSLGAINASGGAAGAGSFGGGNSAEVNITATGLLKTGAITSQVGASTGTAATHAVGNRITLSAANISGTGALLTTGLANGDGGNISLSTTAGSITGIGVITANGGAGVANTGPAGKAGNVTVSGRGGLVTLANAITASGGTPGATTSFAGGNGGTLTVVSDSGILLSSSWAASGGAGATTNGAGGNAGTIQLLNGIDTFGAVLPGATGNIATAALSAQAGSATGTAAGGSAGSILVNNKASGGTVSVGTITTTGGTKSNAGDVTLNSTSGSLTTTSTILATGGAGLASVGGDGGKVSISGTTVDTSLGAINASGGAAGAGSFGGGNSAEVNITATGLLKTGAITSQVGASTGTAATHAVGNRITLSAANISGTGALLTTGLANGDGGNISLSTTAGSITGIGVITANGGAGVANTGPAGKAGNVTVSGRGGLVTLANAITASGGTPGATTSFAGGNGGTLTVVSDSGILLSSSWAASGGAGATTNGAGGNAGTIQLLNGIDTLGTLMAGSTGDITAANLTSQTGNASGTGLGGMAGAIVLNNQASNGNVIDSGALTTSGALGGAGGSVTVTAGLGTATVNSITSTGGAGTAVLGGQSAGAISVAGSGVSTQQITANGGSATVANLSGGAGAAIKISSKNGIGTGRLLALGGNTIVASASAAGGNAGSVIVQNSVSGNISITNGGDVTTTTAMVVKTGKSSGAGSSATPGFISIRNDAPAASGGNMTLGAIDTSGSYTPSSGGGVGGGDGGNVSLAASNVISLGGSSNTVASIYATAGTPIAGVGRNGGNISITGGSVQLNPAAIAAGNTQLATGGTGPVDQALAGGNGGTINVWSTIGDISLDAVKTNSAGTSGSGAQSASGNITMNSAANVAVVSLATSANQNARGGDISVTSAGTINLQGITSSAGTLAIGTTNQDGPSAGNVVLQALGDIQVSQAIMEYGGATYAPGYRGGTGGSLTATSTAGNIQLNTTQGNFNLVTTQGGPALGSTGNGGAAGNVNLTVLDSSKSIYAFGSIEATGGDRGTAGGAPGAGGNVVFNGNALVSGSTYNGLSTFTVNSYGGNAGFGTGGNVVFQGKIETAPSKPATTVAISTNGNETFNGSIGTASALASLTTDLNGVVGGTAYINGGSVKTTGNQTYNDSVSFGASTNINTSLNGNVTFNKVVNANGNSAVFSVGTGSVTATNIGNDFYQTYLIQAGAVNLVDANQLILEGGSVASILARTLSNDLVLTGNLTATSSNAGAITLVADRNFINPGGNSLSATNGSWLVYSTDPTQDIRGASVIAGYDFKQYGTAYGGTLLGTGNGLVYKVSPTVSAGLSGTATKVYDALLEAHTAALSASTSGTGIDGDTVNFTGGAVSSASYDTKDVGVAKVVTAYVSGASLVNATNGARAVYGYGVTAANASAAVGVISKADLTVTANDDARFVTLADVTGYNGVNYSGFVGGETASALNTTGLTVTRNNPSVNGAATYPNVLVPSGVTSNNYNIIPVNGTYTIVAADQLVVKANNTSVIYGSSPAYGSPISVQYRGAGNFVFDLASTYLGANTWLYSDGVGGTFKFTFDATAPGALSGAGLRPIGNYSIIGTNQTVVCANFVGSPLFNGTLTVTPKDLSVAGVIADNKVYDSNLLATVHTSGATYTGLLARDDVTLSAITGQFNNKNVGTGKTVSLSNATLIGADLANYTVVSTQLATSADITKADLAITGISADNKTYESTRAATVHTAAATYAGLYAGDDVTVASTGMFDTKNVGTGKTVALSNSYSGADTRNYNISGQTTTTAAITKATLTIRAVTDTKEFDGTSSSSVRPLITGLASNDSVALAMQTFDSNAVGTGKTLTATAVINDGNSGGNYDIRFFEDHTGTITAPMPVTPRVISPVIPAKVIAGVLGLKQSGQRLEAANAGCSANGNYAGNLQLLEDSAVEIGYQFGLVSYLHTSPTDDYREDTSEPCHLALPVTPVHLKEMLPKSPSSL